MVQIKTNSGNVIFEIVVQMDGDYTTLIINDIRADKSMIVVMDEAEKESVLRELAGK